jgi:hypothetical protein
MESTASCFEKRPVRGLSVLPPCPPCLREEPVGRPRLHVAAGSSAHRARRLSSARVHHGVTERTERHGDVVDRARLGAVGFDGQGAEDRPVNSLSVLPPCPPCLRDEPVGRPRLHVAAGSSAHRARRLWSVRVHHGVTERTERHGDVVDRARLGAVAFNNKITKDRPVKRRIAYGGGSSRSPAGSSPASDSRKATMSAMSCSSSGTCCSVSSRWP